MNKFKLILLISTFVTLVSCTNTQLTNKVKKGYLKDNISQEELYNVINFKRYYYDCRNFDTGTRSYLISYFPLSKESRKKENFGFYFQLDGNKVEPFDHIQNKALNGRGSRFEVIYRSYHPIQGAYVDLVAKEQSSIYYKNNIPWLKCREA
ncbi:MULTISPECIES: hypothetical protein [Glaesserella]|uniref:Lipoprotein n=1 Tax=Glaesserella australis TaxID=2094024 RepID=A0A328C1G4_9PAST|nr:MULTISPECIES: hypothetical protein [Glaesserella]AUI65936.1 hypothetical protein CJD39_04820 [Glaesserella sp. 15-184]RAL18344.1 hypothetical protein C5N92_08980 [Glaesserella australis]